MNLKGFRFFMSKRVLQRRFLRVFVTGIVTQAKIVGLTYSLEYVSVMNINCSDEI